jgi:diguanylate cyclase (GGDEF)-like protein/PAS domain S-box-containing protein
MQLDQFAHALLEAAPDAVVVIDLDGVIRLLNVQAELLLGYPRDELLGRQLESLMKESARRTTRVAARPNRPRHGVYAIELLAQCRDGSTVPVEISLAPVSIGGVAYSIAVLRDLTERQRLEEHLLYVSTHDALTGLANRSAFDDVLVQLEQRGPHPVGVLMVDLDDLKKVNDRYGHAAGDVMLRRLAEVLRSTFRSTDVVARIGGDEFAVLAAGRDAAAVEQLAARLQDAVEAHNRQRADDDPLKLSVGVAVADSGVSVATALHDADARMYSMKRLHHEHR